MTTNPVAAEFLPEPQEPFDPEQVRLQTRLDQGGTQAMANLAMNGYSTPYLPEAEQTTTNALNTPHSQGDGRTIAPRFDRDQRRTQMSAETRAEWMDWVRTRAIKEESKRNKAIVAARRNQTILFQ